MAESTATQQEGLNVTPPEGQQLPATQEELNKMLQSETDKRVTSALQTARAKWETEFNSKLESEKAEAARLAKLTAEQRERELFEKQKIEFTKQQREFQQQQLLNQTMLEMGNAALPVSFARFLMADTADQVKTNLDEFKTQWQQALQKAVDEKLKGTTPRTGTENAGAVNGFYETIQKNKIR